MFSRGVAPSTNAVRIADDGAVFYGLRSRGALQTHQIAGILIMTNDLMHMVTFQVGIKTSAKALQTAIDLCIPYGRIVKFERARDFVALGPLGRARGDGLLVITFIDENDTEEQLALTTKQKADVHTTLEQRTGLQLQR